MTREVPCFGERIVRMEPANHVRLSGAFCFFFFSATTRNSELGTLLLSFLFLGRGEGTHFHVEGNRAGEFGKRSSEITLTPLRLFVYIT